VRASGHPQANKANSKQLKVALIPRGWGHLAERRPTQHSIRWYPSQSNESVWPAKGQPKPALVYNKKGPFPTYFYDDNFCASDITFSGFRCHDRPLTKNSHVDCGWHGGETEPQWLVQGDNNPVRSTGLNKLTSKHHIGSIKREIVFLYVKSSLFLRIAETYGWTGIAFLDSNAVLLPIAWTPLSSDMIAWRDSLTKITVNPMRIRANLCFGGLLRYIRTSFISGTKMMISENRSQ